MTAAAACGAAHKRNRWFLLAQHPDNPAVVTPKPLLDQASAPAATLPTLVASDGRSSGGGPPAPLAA